MKSILLDKNAEETIKNFYEEFNIVPVERCKHNNTMDEYGNYIKVWDKIEGKTNLEKIEHVEFL